MENTQATTCTPKGLYERIRTKLTSTPASSSSIQPSSRRTSRIPQLFMAAPQHFPPPIAHDERNKKVSGATPIQFESSAFATTSSHNTKGGGGGGNNNIIKQWDADSSTNNKFTDFIKRARFKFRTTSDVGSRVPTRTSSDDVGSGGKRISRLDSVNERVSDYIKRAKGKMSKTFKGRD